MNILLHCSFEATGLQKFLTQRWVDRQTVQPVTGTLPSSVQRRQGKMKLKIFYLMKMKIVNHSQQKT